MQVRVANTAEGDVDLNVVRSSLATIYLQWFKGLITRVSTIGLYKHVKPPLYVTLNMHFPASLDDLVEHSTAFLAQSYECLWFL
jgi:hypothetical protein